MASTDAPDEAMEFIAFLTTEGQRLRAETPVTCPSI